MVWKCWFKNVIWTNFLHFVSFPLIETPTFVKTCLWVVFHEAGGLQNEQRFPFQAFEASELSKASTFVKRGVCIHFHQANSLQNEENLLFQTSRASRLSKATAFVKRDVLSIILTKRFFCQKRRVVNYFDKEYKVGKLLGDGDHHRVKYVTNKKTGRKYAAKIISKKLLKSNQELYN